MITVGVKYLLLNSLSLQFIERVHCIDGSPLSLSVDPSTEVSDTRVGT